MSQAFDERSDALVLDVMIVGAGQAGLATGYFLQQAGVRFRLFDGAARVGDSWRRRYNSLVLFSPRSYSALPGMVMQGDPDGYPDKDEIADYLERYAERFGRGAQSGQVAAFGGGVAAARERSRMSRQVVIRVAAMRRASFG